MKLEPIPLNETAIAVRAYSDLCLNTLPNFEGFNARAKAKGLKTTTYKELDVSHLAGTSRMFAVRDNVDGIEMCGIGFVGSSNIPAIHQEFLLETRRKTGGAPKKKLPYPDFHAAYYLKNNSLLAHGVKTEQEYVIHVIIVTKPISDSATLGL